MKDADLLLILTEWNEFKELDLEKVKKLMKTPNIVDARNLYDPEQMKQAGFNYVGIGR
jgi:UDPglucose 6-dehydrogenase